VGLGVLNRVASRQHGLVTAADVQKAGLSWHRLKTLIRDGTYERLTRRLLRATASRACFEQRALAACLAVGAQAVASHTTAAILLGLGSRGQLSAKTIEITVPYTASGRSRPNGVIVHHSRNLSRVDIAKVGVIPVTHPARTVVDCAGLVARGLLAQPTLGLLVDEVIIRRMAGLGRLRDTAARVHPTGCRALEVALAVWIPGPLPGSVPEMTLARALMAAGLPAPKRQHELVDPTTGKTLARFDLAYPQARVGIEYYGGLDHSARQRAHDEDRANRIQSAGWLVFVARKDNLAEVAWRVAQVVTARLVR